MHPSRHTTTLGLLALMLAACATAPRAEEAPTVIFMIDGSGSMWGNLPADKRAKVEITREALHAALQRLRPEVKVGLASFGQRRRGNCTDAEVLVPPQPNNQAQFLPSLDKLNPIGKGPVVGGLRESAAAIGTAAPSSIVMIIDDVDNCGQDVCAAAGDIAKANSGLAVHTIGLGLDKPRLQQLSCVASLTGGRLYDAQNPAGVAAALDEIIKLAHLETPSSEVKLDAPKDAAPKPPEDAAPGLYLSAGLGPESATLESPVRWRVTKGGPGGEVIREVKAPSLVEKVSPGTYEVEAKLGLASARQSVDVKADAPTAVRINLDAGVLKLLARASKGGPALPTPVFTVTALDDSASKKAGTVLWMGREPQPEIVLPAGDYRVTAENGRARQEQTVKIAAATGTTFDAMLATGRLELSATRGTSAAPGDAVTDGMTYIVQEDDPDAPGGRREVARSSAPTADFTLPAGTYYVTARAPGAELREQIAIGAGDVVRRALPLNLARLKLSATLDGAPPPEGTPLTFKVYRLDPDPREILRTGAREPELELSAGKYRIEASLGSSNVRAAADLAIAAGQNLKAVLKLEAGQITLKLADGQSSPGDVFWEIKDERQHTVMRSSQPQPTALLAPGKYVVTTETSSAPMRSDIELKAGEHRTVEIGG